MFEGLPVFVLKVWIIIKVLPKSVGVAANTSMFSRITSTSRHAVIRILVNQTLLVLQVLAEVTHFALSIIVLP